MNLFVYNGLISGFSLHGVQFFYPNALESNGVHKFNQGACTRKDWLDCSCCPTNVIRFIPSLPSLVYPKATNTVYVNLYASNTAKVELENNTVNISQKTEYPWNGKVALTVDPEKEGEFGLKLRVPAWTRNEVLPGDLYNYISPSKSKITILVNGESVDTQTQSRYITLTRNWKKDETVELDFPIGVKEVVTSSMVADNEGKAVSQYGPLVYAVEEVDKNNFDALAIGKSDTFTVKREEKLLGGIDVSQNKRLKVLPYYA